MSEHGKAGTPEHEQWLKSQMPVLGDSTNDIELVRLWIADATHDELRTLRAIINGKLSKRTITKEQQDKMQAAREKK